MTEPRPLNRFEIFVSEHAARIFVVIALAIVFGAGAVYWVYQRSGDAQQQVEVLRPQVTRISHAVCDRRSLEHPDRAAACAERIRIGLVNCRRSQPCRAALLAAITYPPPARGATLEGGATSSPPPADATEGGGAQNPSHAGQQPSPGDPGHHGGGGDNGGQETSPAPSPGASAPAAPEGGGAAEPPGNGAQGSQGGESSSGADVEVCALEGTCVGIEVGVAH